MEEGKKCELAYCDMAILNIHYLKLYKVGLEWLESGSKRTIEIEQIMIMGS